MLNKEELKNQCLAECLGTALAVFFGLACLAAIVAGGAEYGLWEISIVWGLGFTLAIYLTAGISGGHLNPAVTIALAIFAGFDRKKVAPYIGAQFVGAFIGSAICYFLYSDLIALYELSNEIVRGSPESLVTAGIFGTYANAAISIPHAAAVEFFITGCLMVMIMALTDDSNGIAKGPLAPLLIGLAIAALGATTAPLTGFAMNPARDFAPKVMAMMAGWGEVSLTGARSIPYFIVPFIAPVLGAISGAALYRKCITAALHPQVKVRATTSAS
ncbi:MIP/aquaporin family protein [Thaumasiovibrio sp. DFM-14]|uniref:MIP/aquaporin family protein n=1 Tax=Thaumasiovibrio sp. DFM-14 TaxID=3384792 RepID=UPI00399F0A52